MASMALERRSAPTLGPTISWRWITKGLSGSLALSAVETLALAWSAVRSMAEMRTRYSLSSSWPKRCAMTPGSSVAARASWNWARSTALSSFTCTVTPPAKSMP